MFQSNVVCGDVCDGGMEEGGGGQGVSLYLAGMSQLSTLQPPPLVKVTK